MNEWEVVGVIIALVGFLAVIIPVFTKLTKQLTTLNCNFENMNRAFADLSTKNTDAHARLWKKSEQHDQRLSEHDTEISVIKTELRDKRVKGE